MAGRKKPTNARARAKAKEAADHSPTWNASRASKPSKKVKEARAKKRVSKEALDKLQAGRERAQREKAALVKVQINLHTYHQINDTIYGPGHVWVPRGLVSALLEQDRHAQEAESALFTQRSNIIGAGNRLIPVANSNFDAVWAGASPPVYETVSGKGVVDVGQGPRF